jgi:hypothetical protein
MPWKRRNRRSHGALRVVTRLQLFAVAVDQPRRAWSVRHPLALAHHTRIATSAMDWLLPTPSPPAVAVALVGRCIDDGTMPSSASLHRLARSMDIPFSLTLSFDDLEVLVLAENGGATPLDVEESLGLERQHTKALFRHLVRRGLLDWHGSPHAQGALP